jgi:phage-related protein (TIGR01555 family)
MQLVVRNDGLVNSTNGMGGSSDGFAGSKYNYLQSINSASFYNLYKHNGLIKKIIDLPSYDATRNWIEIEEDNADRFIQHLKKINAKLHLTNALKMTRLYGSALVVLDIDDGISDIVQPVNVNRVRDVKILHTFPTHEFSPVFENDNVLNYEKYQLVSSNTNLEQVFIHKSRTILLTNNPLFADNCNKFESSTIFEVIEPVKRLDYIRNIITKLMEISQYDIIQIDKEELDNFMTNGNNAEEAAQIIKTKLEFLNKSKSVYNTMATMSGDSIQRLQSNFSNYDNLITKCENEVASVSYIPTHVLFGTEKSGLSKSGDSELEVYYNFVSGIQETILTPAIAELLFLISKCIGNNVKDPVFTFNPLWQMSDIELAEYDNKNADTIKKLTDSGMTVNMDSVHNIFGGRYIDIGESKKTQALDTMFYDPANL